MSPIAPRSESASGSNDDSTPITARTRSGSMSAAVASATIVRESRRRSNASIPAIRRRSSRSTRSTSPIGPGSHAAAAHASGVGGRDQFERDQGGETGLRRSSYKTHGRLLPGGFRRRVPHHRTPPPFDAVFPAELLLLKVLLIIVTGPR